MENPALDPERPAPPLNEVVIRDLRPDLKSIWVKRFIVLDKGPPLVNKENDRIFTVRVADATGTCILNAFNERGEAMEPGDIFELKVSQTSLFRVRNSDVVPYHACVLLVSRSGGLRSCIGSNCGCTQESLDK